MSTREIRSTDNFELVYGWGGGYRVINSHTDDMSDWFPLYEEDLTRIVSMEEGEFNRYCGKL